MNLPTSNLNEAQKIKFIEDHFKDKCYLAARLLMNISPTLFSSKPATLVSLNKTKNKDNVNLWDTYGAKVSLSPGVEVIELKRESNKVILLFFNREKLKATLIMNKHKAFLKRFGYSEKMDIDGMLEHLKSRYTDLCPHEIGIFLGIPLRDIMGYLGLTSLPCTLCGYWKVYGNPEKTQKLFKGYRKTRKMVIGLMSAGEDPCTIISQPHIYRCNSQKYTKKQAS